jgi:AraC-like DNA-binding protein
MLVQNPTAQENRQFDSSRLELASELNHLYTLPGNLAKQFLSLINVETESNANGFIVINSHNRIVSFNDKFRQMWRIPEAMLKTGDYERCLSFYRTQLNNSASFGWFLLVVDKTSNGDSYHTLDLKDGRVFKAHLQTLRLGKEILGRVWRFWDITEESSEEIASSSSEELLPSQLSQVFQFIEANYHESIGLKEVARAVGYSPAYLTDLVGRWTGKTVYRWIIERRMDQACWLLSKTSQSVTEIATAVGYGNLGCFFREFRQKYGMTPKNWRRYQLAAS